jgi:beta-glucosidase
VTNTGSRQGDEVVQLYVHDRLASVTRPVQELRGFERITLAPGERRTVRFRLGQAELAFLDRAMRRVVEPGIFEVRVGGSSTRTTSVTLEVVAGAGR